MTPEESFLCLKNCCWIGGMKADGLKRMVSRQVFCQMRGRATQVFREKICKGPAFSVESFFTNLYGQALEKFLTRNHGNPIDFQRLLTEVEQSYFRFWVVLSEGFQ